MFPCFWHLPPGRSVSFNSNMALELYTARKMKACLGILSQFILLPRYHYFTPIYQYPDIELTTRGPGSQAQIFHIPITIISMSQVDASSLNLNQRLSVPLEELIRLSAAIGQIAV